MNDERFNIATCKANEALNLMSVKSTQNISTYELVRAIEKMTDTVIHVKETDFSEIDDDCTYGAMMCVTQKDNHKVAYIILNSNTEINDKFRRFSLVHELGHLATGKYNISDKDNSFTLSMHINYKLSNIEQEDYENDEYLLNEEIANVFALKVLIPYKSLTEKLEEDFNLKRVSDFFGVPEQAIKSRLKLGL